MQMDAAPKIFLQCIGGKLVPVSLGGQDRISSLRQLACQQMKCEQATLIANGKLLHEGDDMSMIGDVLASTNTVLAAPVRKSVKVKLSDEAGDLSISHSASQSIHGDAGDGDDDLMDDDPAKAPDGASPMQINIGGWLEEKQIPPAFLAIFYLLSLKQWSLLGVWILGGPFASAHGVGAVYVGASLIVLICMNLGRRKAGEASAYSVFNRGFQRLPGDFTDEQVDNAFRGRL